jgi:hypothetical protein
MEVIKSKSEVGTYDISIKENDNKNLSLVWGGNGDLYWILDNLEDIDVKEDPMYDSFCITKENYALYSLFEELYDDWNNVRCHAKTATVPKSYKINLKNFSMPIKRDLITSKFGKRWGRNHNGVDIKAYHGDTI